MSARIEEDFPLPVDIVVYVTTDEEVAPFTIETKFPGIPNMLESSPGLYSASYIARKGTMNSIHLPSGGEHPESDISVQDSYDRHKGVRIRTKNNEHKLTVYVLSSSSLSADGYTAIPCVSYPTARDYQYFVFSADSLSSRYFSRFMIVPCEDDTSISIEGSQSIESPSWVSPSVSRTDPQSPNAAQRIVTYGQNIDQFETLMIDNALDLTGTIVVTNKPISLFVGHQCGNVPDDAFTCDYLAEQVPPHITYGSLFFTAPFAVRESGDLYRVGTVWDGVQLSVVCTQEGNSTPNTQAFTLDRGDYYEFMTHEGPIREFCSIQSNLPVTVMQYTVGHSIDFVQVPGRPSPQGDPSMIYVPPVAQYTQSTIDIIVFSQDYISYVLPIPLNESNNLPDSNARSILVNGSTFNPDSDYQPIYCDGSGVHFICAYGAYSSLDKGVSTIKHNELGALWVMMYGFGREVSYAYPGLFELEPIGSKLYMTL